MRWLAVMLAALPVVVEGQQDCTWDVALSACVPPDGALDTAPMDTRAAENARCDNATLLRGQYPDLQGDGCPEGVQRFFGSGDWCLHASCIRTDLSVLVVKCCLIKVVQRQPATSRGQCSRLEKPCDTVVPHARLWSSPCRVRPVTGTNHRPMLADAQGCASWQAVQGKEQYTCQVEGYAFEYFSGYEASRSAANCSAVAASYNTGNGEDAAAAEAEACRQNITAHWERWGCAGCVAAYAAWFRAIDDCARFSAGDCGALLYLSSTPDTRTCWRPGAYTGCDQDWTQPFTTFLAL